MASKVSPTKQAKMKTDFLTLKEDLKECKRWFVQNGFCFESSRFNKGLKILTKYEQRRETVKKDEIWLLSELIDLYGVYKLLRNSPTDEITNNLKKTMGGTITLSVEKNTAARNYFFELKVATRFKTCGCEVTLPAEQLTDIEFKLNGFQYKVECKRVQSKKSIKKRIKQASTQLTKKLSAGEVGIIALDFSKLLYDTYKKQDFLATTEDDAIKIRTHFDQTIPSYCEDILHQNPNNRVDIILGHIRFPVFTLENSMTTINHFFTLRNNKKTTPNSNSAITTLIKELKSSIEKDDMK